MRMNKIEEEPTDADVERLRERARALGYELVADGRDRWYGLQDARGVWIALPTIGGARVDGDLRQCFSTGPGRQGPAYFLPEIEAWLAAKEPARGA